MGARPRTSCTLACPDNTPVAAPAYASGRQTASGFSPCSGAGVWSVVTKRLGATRWKHGTGAELASEDSGAPDISSATLLYNNNNYLRYEAKAATTEQGYATKGRRVSRQPPERGGVFGRG